MKRAILQLLLFLAPPLAPFLGLVACPSLAFAQQPAPQTIQIAPIADKTLNAPPFQIIALASSGLPVSLQVSGPATVFHRELTLTGTGTVTVTATQAGNGSFAPAASQQVSFQVSGALPTVAWTPGSLTYGMPVSAAMLSATATAVPVVDAAADASTVTSQLGSSQLTGGTEPTVDQFSPFLRYEGSTMQLTTDPNGGNGLQANGSVPPLGLDYRVVFTCDCQRFEWIMQSRQSNWRLWVDGQWATVDTNSPADHYPEKAFYLVRFPDKRPRQIKVATSGNPPFFGLITMGTDTISAPQVPIGKRVIIMGDSWTGPTISPPLLPPAQAGLYGSGFAQVVAEYFNWDYWVTSAGGEGFNSGGIVHENYGQRALTDLCGRAPDAMMIVGGVNDGDVTAAQVQSDATDLLSTLASCLPGVPVYIAGPQAVNQPDSQGLAAAAAQPPAGSTFAYFDMSPSASANDPANWLYGSFNDATVGNAYLYIGTNEGEGGHPTPLGHDYVAERLEDALTRQYPALTQANYVLFTPVPLAGSVSYSVPAGALLPAGTNQVTATFTPQDGTHYAVASATATVAVARAGTTLALQAGQPTGSGSVVVHATAAPQFGGTPIGTLTVSDGTIPLGSVPLVGGSASYTASGLAAGMHALTVAYSGDANFTGSSAAAQVQVVPVPDFSFSLGTPAAPVAAGSTTSISIALTPSNGLTGTLTASCAGLPAGATCTLSGAPIAVSGSAQTLTLQVALPPALARQSAPAAPLPLRVESLLAGVVLGGLTLARVRRRGTGVFLLALLCAGTVALSGCGASSKASQPTPSPISYTVQVSLTVQGPPVITHTEPLLFTVQ